MRTKFLLALVALTAMGGALLFGLAGIATGSVDAQFKAFTSFDYEDANGLKDVASCSAQVTDAYAGTFTIDYAYPNYWCAIQWGVVNTGTIPVNVSVGDFADGDGDVKAIGGCAGGQPLLPAESLQCQHTITINKSAPENTTYNLSAQIDVVQFDKALPGQAGRAWTMNWTQTMTIAGTVSTGTFDPPPPSFRELAEYWAPVIYQDTDSSDADADFITNFDFDGNWDGIDNWDNQPSNALNANVYYWVVETSTNWFIGYGLYHPRDWGEAGIAAPCTVIQCHENDMEGALLTIQKDSSLPFGQFLLMNTLAHADIFSYQDTAAPPSAAVTGPFAGDVEFENGRPLIYSEAKGHGITGAERWELEDGSYPNSFPGNHDGVIYRYTGTPEEPASGNEASVGYDLRNIQELWSRRCDFLGGTAEQAFASFGTFRGDDYGDNKAGAPWGWTDKDGFFDPRSSFFVDPAATIYSAFGNLGSFSQTYSGASFSPGPNDSAEVSCMPIELGDGVSLTYEQVTGTGVTTSSTSSTGPLTPANYQPGTPAVYHDLSTTSTFSGSIEVCSDYDESTYELEEGIRLFHYDGQAWDDITTNLDTANDRVCGVTLDLSPFHLAEIIPGQDLDGDGCTNGTELGFDPALGGLRDYENPWDFYDVAGSPLPPPQGTNGDPDKIIDLPNDILGVIQHFSPSGAVPYDVQFDRGPSSGPNPWNMTAPDGVIGLPNDILGVIKQYNHRLTLPRFSGLLAS